MGLRVYEVLFHFNQGLDQALSSVDILEKLEMQWPYCITKIRESLGELRAYANTHLASNIAQVENEEHEHFSSRRRKRERDEENPNQIYIELETSEWLRRERGLPPRAVILPWTKADDDRALARLKVLYSAPPAQAPGPQPPPKDSPLNSPKEEGGSEQ
jgi:hypothetical protein